MSKQAGRAKRRGQDVVVVVVVVREDLGLRDWTAVPLPSALYQECYRSKMAACLSEPAASHTGAVVKQCIVGQECQLLSSFFDCHLL